MSITCPRCQSVDVIPTQESPSLAKMLGGLNASALAGLGASLCRSNNLHPAIGVVAGSVASVVVDKAVSQLDLTSHDDSLNYRCLDCQLRFQG